MGKNANANKPCSCGSRKKYKKCCMDKEKDLSFLNPENFLKDYKNVKKEAKIKQCLYPDNTLCSEKIIDAHSLQNNKILKRISSNGEIYMPCSKPDNLFAVMTKWGRKEATVFTGFCGYHDNEIFKPIETNFFDKSDLHVFLYTYRCFAVEYHKKQEVINMQKVIFKQKPSLNNMQKKDNPFKGVSMAINDLQLAKEEFDKALLTNSYDILSSVIWEFSAVTNFAATGFEAPTYDLGGNTIQNLLDCSVPARHIFVMVFPEGEKTYCIISWLKSNDDLFNNLRRQLASLDEEQQKIYINNTLPVISENIVINPDAWNKWEQHKKDEFGILFWGISDISELLGHPFDRLSPPTYDLFSL